MLKFKMEHLLILIAVLLVGLFAYRYSQKNTSQKETSSETSSSPDLVTPQTLPTINTADTTPLPLPSQKHPKVAPPAANEPSAMNTYRKLLNTPGAGLERLNLIDQLKSQEPAEKLAMMAFYEVLNSGPEKGLSLEENHQRRNVVSVAFGMYLDHCGDFKACYPYGVTALARYPDQEMVDDLLPQLLDKFTEPWQRKQMQEEMKKYGLKPKQK